MIHIVTDSTSDIPPDFVRELDITVVPAHVIFGEDSYDDGVTITRDEFYQRLATSKELPTTATPSAGEFAEVYQRLGGEIISIHLAAKLSGVLNTAYAAAQLVPDIHVTLFDSDSLAMGLGWQVIAAARAAQAGQSSAQIIRLLENLRPRVHVYAGLDTLEYLRRSGRVSWASAMLGQLLNIKPIIEVKDGGVAQLERVRTRRTMLKRLKQIAHELGPLDSLAVQHTRAYDDARAMAAELAATLNVRQPIVVCEATTTIGTHIGPNGLGI
ncbi:MAG TPA: DegV family protein, partial [Anaerolineae bacterium]|nr:DegV family protein [Anaerolineae bacterium]